MDRFSFVKRAGYMSLGKRESLPSKSFAIPARKAKKIGVAGQIQGKAKGKYPIPDLKHARNALARVSQHGTLEERMAVRRKVYSKYPELKEGFKARHGTNPMAKKNLGKEKLGEMEFSDDPTKLMPRLRQIHKLGDFPTGSGPEDWDAMKQSPGRVKQAAGLLGGLMGQIPQASTVPSMSEQFYASGVAGETGDGEGMPLELLMMAGPGASQGAQMAQMANRLAERKGKKFQQKAMAREGAKAQVVNALAAELAKLQMEKKGSLTSREKEHLTRESIGKGTSAGVLAGGLGGTAVGSLVSAATGKGIWPTLTGTMAGMGVGALLGARRGKKRAPERWKAYEEGVNKLVPPATLSHMAKKHGLTDAQARSALIGVGDVRGHSWYPREGSRAAKDKFIDQWLAGSADDMRKLGYKLQGQTEVQGIPIAIENKPGSIRSGVDKDGEKWETKMRVPYGYIKGTKGADGEEVDAFVGPKKGAKDAYVVHQHKPDGKGYDEDKVMLGFPSKAEAKKTFLQHYDDPKFLGPIARVSTERLKELVATKKRLVKISQVSYRAMLDELLKCGR